MPDITAGYTYTDTSGANYTVNHSNLNSLIGSATINTGVITTAKLDDGSVTNAKVDAAAGITFTKLASLTSGTILLGSSGNVATSTAVSGDVTITNAGVVTIANDAVTTAKVLDANITTAKLADSTGASDGVTAAKLATGAVTPAKLEAGTQGDVLYFGSGGTAARLGAGADGQFLQSGGAGADPSWAYNPVFETETFTADGTWTKPAGATWVQVTVVGGGGAGGTGSTNNRGQAGGHGGYGVDWVDISAESTVTVTVGSGGGVGVGESGGQSSFGSYVVSTGGTEGSGDAHADTHASSQAACGTVTFNARDTGLSLNKQPPNPASYYIPTIASVGAKGAGGVEQYDNGTAPTAGADGFVTVRVVG
jgi:hypothetical protein